MLIQMFLSFTISTIIYIVVNFGSVGILQIFHSIEIHPFEMDLSIQNIYPLKAKRKERPIYFFHLFN